MQAKSILLSLALAIPAMAQNDANLVTNGDFTGTLLPWVMGGGYSCAPGLDTTYATDGITVSDAFGAGPGGQVTPGPYPPNTIEQSINVVFGTTYELRADVSSSRASASGTNADAGTIYAQVNGVEVARITFGNITITETKRAHLCARFVASVTGSVPLTIFMERRYLCNTGTPRVNVDNVSVEDVTGPTYCIVGNRKIGTTVTFQVEGEPNAVYATFLAGGATGGLAIPGFNGLYTLDLGSTSLFLLGGLDAAGLASVPLSIPNDPTLKNSPLFHQAVTVGGSNEIGLGFGCVFTSS